MKKNYNGYYLRPIALPMARWSGFRKFMLLAISCLAIGQVAVASGKGGGSKGPKPGAEAQRGPGGDSLGRRGNFVDYAVERKGGDSVDRRGNFVDYAVERKGGDSVYRRGNFIDYAVERKGGDSVYRRGNFVDYAVERKGGDSVYRRGNFVDYAVERKGGDSVYRRGNFVDYAVERKGGDSVHRRGNFVDYAVERKGGDSVYRRGNFVEYSVERGPGGDSLGRIGLLQSNGLEVVAFPNPTVGMLNLRVGGNAEGNLTAGVMDLSGKMVLPMTAISAQMAQLDLGQLPSGTYLVQVRSANQTITTRIVKD